MNQGPKWAAIDMWVPFGAHGEAQFSFLNLLLTFFILFCQLLSFSKLFPLSLSHYCLTLSCLPYLISGWHIQRPSKLQSLLWGT